jgi:type IX secretion system PorP/SprF family membrane protein
MRPQIIKVFVVTMLIFSSKIASAQYEPLFTQYMFNEVFLNPAYAGSREVLSASALYRNQWVGIDGAPVTQTFNIHTPLGKGKNNVGLSIMNEKIGVTHETALYGHYAFRIKMKRGQFALGLQAGLINHQERWSELKTYDELTGGNKDVNLRFNTPNMLMPNAGFGMYYYSNKFYAGISTPRLLKNKVNLTTDNEASVKNSFQVENLHYYIASGYVCNISENVDLKPSVLIKVVSGAPVEADLSLAMLINKFVWVGAAYRTNDAVSGIVGLQITNQLRFSYSYDYTLTELTNYTSGSHEIAVGYDLVRNKQHAVTPRFF